MVAWAYEGCPRSHFPPFWLQRQVPFLSRVECCSATGLFHRFLSTTLVSYVWKSTTQSNSFRQTVILGQTMNLGRQSYGRSHLVKWAWEGLFFATSAPHSKHWLLALPITACGLRLGDEAVRTAVVLRLGTTLCVPHPCPCGAGILDGYPRYWP